MILRLHMWPVMELGGRRWRLIPAGVIFLVFIYSYIACYFRFWAQAESNWFNLYLFWCTLFRVEPLDQKFHLYACFGGKWAQVYTFVKTFFDNTNRFSVNAEKHLKLALKWLNLWNTQFLRNWFCSFAITSKITVQ